MMIVDLFDERMDWTDRWAGPDDLSIILRDARRTTRQANNSPSLLAIRSAEGVHVEDGSGRRYIDLHGNNCHHIGYRHPHLMAELAEQLNVLPFTVRGFTNETFVRLAEELSELWPGRDGRVFLVPGGAAAIELALAIARVHTGRHKSISFDGSYHGRSFGAVSLSGTAHNRSPRLGPLLPGTLHVPSYRPSPHEAARPDHDPEAAARHSLKAIRRVMDREGDIACVVGETILNGAHRPPDWYWPEIRRLCDAHDSLLVFDEIPTGLGKTGALFNSSHFGVRPDMTVVGKALGGAALPAAAVVADGELDTAGELNLGYFTHEKNPLLARAALATLEVVRSEKLAEKSQRLGADLLERLTALQGRHADMVGGVRGAGLMASFDIVMPERDAVEEERTVQRIFHRAIEKGLILNYSGRGTTIALSFPLTVETDVLDAAEAILDETLSEVSAAA